LHLGGRFFEHREQFAHLVKAPHDHDHKGFEEEPLGINEGAPTRAARGRRRGGDVLDEPHQLDKDAILVDHGDASEKRVYGHKPSSRRLLVSGQASRRYLIYDHPSAS
jgi:hypothetical protein